MVTGESATPSRIGRDTLKYVDLPWSTDTFKKTSQFVKVLEKRVADIFKTVFAREKERVKFVLAVQSVWPDGSVIGLEFAKTVYGPLENYFDYLSIAPYVETYEDWNINSVDDVFRDIEMFALNPGSSAWLNVSRFFTDNALLAKRYNLPLIGYEGGQGLNGAYKSEFKVAAQHDPRMTEVYKNFFAMWDEHVGHSNLFVHFSDVTSEGQWGAWGLLTRGSYLGSLKYDTVMQLSQVAGDANFDGVVSALDCDIVKNNLGRKDAWWREGDFNHDRKVDTDDMTLVNSGMKTGSCR
jgi:hypothetical protein